MGRTIWKLFSLAFVGGAATVEAASRLPGDCSSSGFDIPGLFVESVEHLKSGQNIPLPDTVSSCGGSRYSANATNDACRVVIKVPTSDSSAISLEAWLPDEWNGRFLATGNGGIGGCIDYLTMQNGAQLGFAAFGTNAGHDGSEGYDFFLNEPEVINDFGHRAIHVEAEAGKEVVRKYYGKEHFKSYYQGCSTGGRQGFQTAQMYPKDFDGVLLGAAAVDWLHIVASKGILAGRIGWPHLNADHYVRPEQWKAIVAKQIELFDALDGVEDGIIDNPTDFSFDPEILACGTGTLKSTLCLNPEQVLSVRRAYEPLTDGEGRFVYPSFGLGANTAVFSENQVNGTAQLTYRVLDDFWRGAVYNDSTWNSLYFNETDMDFAIRLNPGGVGFNNGDLSDYEARGGKRVQAALDFTVEEMHSFYRLFLIPGHSHCTGGIGSWDVGQTYPMDPGRLEPAHNALLALTEWVENGKPPDQLIGTKHVDDNFTKGVISQRKHCPYPYRSIWDGHSDSAKATSWSCEMALEEW